MLPKTSSGRSKFGPYLFEFFIYQKMYHLINRGKLCCNASVSYCDINHDLINDLLVDDMQLRKAIRTARNRIESYHQLQSLIRKIYNNVFKGRKIGDNRVSAHAARLVANCIVAYNATILNRVYERMVSEGVPQEVL